MAGGLASAAVAVTLSGCASEPALSIFGGLSDRCFETSTTDEGFFALVGITVANESPRSVILREARVLELTNATVREIAVVPMPSVYTIFGVAPGGDLTPDQRTLFNARQPVEGTSIEAGGTIEIVVELHANDYTDYAGLRGLSLRYDDGWFSATSTADAVLGFVPPWSSCGAHDR